MIRPLFAVALVATLIGCASSPRASGTGSRYQQQTLGYLAGAYDRMLSDRGYRMQGNAITGRLEDEASARRDIRLRGGRSYAILGACDEDCDDLDLYLFDDDGDEIDSDLATDDFPILRYTPRRSGDYRLRIRMYNCNREPCYFAVGIYYRQR